MSERMRPITPDDLWSAIRGCSLFQRPEGELIALVAQHEALAKQFFASAVIAEAAVQVLAVRRRNNETDA